MREREPERMRERGRERAWKRRRRVSRRTRRAPGPAGRDPDADARGRRCRGWARRGAAFPPLLPPPPLRPRPAAPTSPGCLHLTRSSERRDLFLATRGWRRGRSSVVRRQAGGHGGPSRGLRGRRAFPPSLWSAHVPVARSPRARSLKELNAKAPKELKAYYSCLDYYRCVVAAVRAGSRSGGRRHPAPPRPRPLLRAVPGRVCRRLRAQRRPLRARLFPPSSPAPARPRSRRPFSAPPPSAPPALARPARPTSPGPPHLCLPLPDLRSNKFSKCRVEQKAFEEAAPVS